MKFFTTTIATTLLAALASASEDENVDGRKMGQTKSILAAILGISDTDAKALIKNYGCYCYPNNQNMVGPLSTTHYNGPAVDDMDAACKALFRSQRCLQFDIAEGTYSKACTVEEGFSYDSDNSSGVEVFTCSTSQSACKQAMCEMELDFANTIAGLVNNGYAKDNQYFKMTNAEYAASCPTGLGGSGNNTPMQCCGTGLNRKTYNPLIQTCCSEVISSLGTC